MSLTKSYKALMTRGNLVAFAGGATNIFVPACQNGPQMIQRSTGRPRAGVNITSCRTPSKEEESRHLKSKVGGNNCPGWSRFAAYRPVSRPRSLIIVEKGTEVGTKSLPRKPYGDQRGNKAGPSYKSHVAMSVTIEQVAVACPIA